MRRVLGNVYTHIALLSLPFVIAFAVTACGVAPAPSGAVSVGSWGGRVEPVAVDASTTCYVVVYGGEPKSIDCVVRESSR